MPKCQYQFTNNSKTHKANDICGAVIRKKGCNYCWKHQKNDNYVVPLDENNQTKQENEFIQLENSIQK
jgi:hypothetical protein